MYVEVIIGRKYMKGGWGGRRAGLLYVCGSTDMVCSFTIVRQHPLHLVMHRLVQSLKAVEFGRNGFCTILPEETIACTCESCP